MTTIMSDTGHPTGESTPNDSAAADGPLPAGRWDVDPAQSRVGFTVKTMWGLATVKGHFHRYTGSLEVDETGSRGTLEIESASLDTKLGKRDDHLRSADFFSADKHPNVTFTINSIAAAGDGVAIDGDLVIKGSPVHLHLPVTVGGDGGERLQLTASATVERETAGMTWNRIGMIKGPAKLDVDLVLERAH
jgi:polyisoprenoid-binding protein YceI